MNIGQKIKKLRKEKNLTQKQLADAIHKSEVTIRKYESNDISPTVDVLIDILKVLDSRLSIETNDNLNNLLRQYIESFDFDISEDTYNELENFIHNFVIVYAAQYSNDVNSINFQQALGRVNRVKKQE